MNEQTIHENKDGSRGVEPKTCITVLREIAKMLFPSNRKPEEIFSIQLEQMQIAALAAAVLGREVNVTMTFNGNNELSTQIDEDAVLELASMEQLDILTKIVPALDDKFTVMHKTAHARSPFGAMLFDILKDAGKQAAEEAKDAA